MEEEQKADWDQFFSDMAALFSNNCLILFEMKEGHLKVEAIASSADSLGFVLGSQQGSPAGVG